MKRILPLLLVLLAPAAPARADNWSNWRGPGQNGVSPDRDLPDTFNARPNAANSNVLWRAPVGGISEPIIQNGRVYIITKTGEAKGGKTTGEGVHQQERVVCFDAKGKQLWEHKYNVFLTDIVRDRLGWGHLCGDPETGNVYVQGSQGFFQCFDKDGKLLWQHSLTEEFGRVTGYGGRVVSPVVDEDLVILGLVNSSWGEQTIGGTRFLACDKRTGAVRWWASTGYRVKDTYYSNPVVANVGGQRLLISGGGDGGVHAFKVRTGEKVWSYIFCSGAVNCSPVVQGNRVYIGTGEEIENSDVQGRVICLDGSVVEKGEPKLVWKVDGIKDKFASPVLHEGRLYVCDELGRMFCLDADSGKEIWQYQFGRNTKGSPVWADGKLYIGEVDGRFHILRPGADSCKELAAVRFRSPGVAPVEINGSPAVADGRLYFMTNYELFCVGKKDHKAPPDKIPEPPVETPAAPGAKPALLQVVPADVTLLPGQSAEFTVRAFDDKGHLLGETKAEWSLAGPLPPVFPIGLTPPKPTTPPAAPRPLQGTLSEKSGTATKLTVGDTPPAQFGRVVAKANGLTGYARVRVAPRLPYSNNFSQVPVGAIPAAWINAQAKFAVAEHQGERVLKKRNDNPNALVAQAYTFIGKPDLSDYTIETDIQGGKVGENLPDMGVVNCRYELWLAGNSQQLRLLSWVPQPRIDKSIPFAWKGDAWYRMKLKVTVNGDKALIQGKAWERGQEEPAKWNVEFEDPCPNRDGSPGLYGDAKGVLSSATPGTPIYYANVRVTPNKK
jgi:outer membrane protein assembly factor BamB